MKTLEQLVQRYKNFSKADKWAGVIAILAVVVVAVSVFSPNLLSGESEAAVNDAESVSVSTAYKSEEQRLEELLSEVDGVGRVKVMITYESGPERVPVTDVQSETNEVTEDNSQGTSRTTNSQSQSSRSVTVNGQNGTEALVLVEKEPKVRGVVVVCEGAENVSVKLKVMDAVKTVLDIPLERVDVFAMKQ